MCWKSRRKLAVYTHEIVMILVQLFQTWFSEGARSAWPRAKLKSIHRFQLNMTRPPLAWSPIVTWEGRNEDFIWKPHAGSARPEPRTHAWLARESGALPKRHIPFLKKTRVRYLFVCFKVAVDEPTWAVGCSLRFIWENQLFSTCRWLRVISTPRSEKCP